MENDLTNELTIDSLPWVRDILDQAGGMMSSGVSAETVILAVVAVPLGLRIIQLAQPYVQTHNDDMRETIRLEKMRQLVEMREKSGADVFADAMAAMDAGSISSGKK
jgi:pantothenate kinase type III